MFSLLRICEVLYENYVPVALDAEERNAQGQGGGLGPEGRWRTTSGPSNEAKCQANLALWEDGRILKPAKVERKHPGVSVAGQCWCFNARRVKIHLLYLDLESGVCKSYHLPAARTLFSRKRKADVKGSLEEVEV